MPRNNQIIRQWAILRAIKSSSGRTLQQLAESLPSDVSRHLRTLRRDLSALEASGFPFFSERMDGEVRWRLIDGYGELPMLPFSPQELTALFMASRLLQPFDGTTIQLALDSAIVKIAAGLPHSRYLYYQKLKDIVAVSVAPHRSYRGERKFVDRLLGAIENGRVAHLLYASKPQGKTTRNKVDPYRLWFAAGALYLIAYCHQRKRVVLFPVERIQSVSVTNQCYEIRTGFDLETFVSRVIGVIQGPRLVMGGSLMTVELLFSRHIAAWVKGRMWHASQELSDFTDGQLRMRLQVPHNAGLVAWILSFGADVKVVSPMRLRTAVQEVAKHIAESE